MVHKHLYVTNAQNHAQRDHWAHNNGNFFPAERQLDTYIN